MLYADLAATAMASFISSKDTPLMEPVRLNDGFEESKEALKKFRGEDDDDFQFLEYQVCLSTFGVLKTGTGSILTSRF